MTGLKHRPIRFFASPAACHFAARVAAILFLVVCAASVAGAQSQWPSGTVAHLLGQDISSEGGIGGPILGATSLFINSGDVITVHSGEARLELEGGGIVDICGPAKFTLLASGGAYTLALNFGRVHVVAPETTPIRLYSPFLIVTPVGIAGEARDLTLGLDVNDTMCLYAAHGAARLEQQLGGDSLVVPQTGEFSLAGEKLSAVVDASGSCRCSAYHETVRTVEPASPVAAAQVPSPTPAAKAPAAADGPIPDPAPSFPAPADEGARLSTQPAISIPSPPEVEPPVWKVIMPPLVFSASSPPPPEDYAVMVTLVRQARVSPDWVFTGHVKERAQETGAEAGQKPGTGFWSKVKRFLFGGPRPSA